MKFLTDEELTLVQKEFVNYKSAVKESANDLPTAPYKSKYKAIEALEHMKVKLNSVFETQAEQHKAALASHMLAQCGVIKAEVQEFTLAEKFLISCLEMCDMVQEEKYTLSARLAAHNQLGILWCNRDDMEKARQHLDKSLNIYFNFSNENSQELFLFENLIYPHNESNINRRTEIEMLVTHTYYYLAQVHGKLGNRQKSAELCHETLSRQLRMNEYDPLDWASNAAVLSQFYLNQSNFKGARYHLACATVILDKHYPDISSITDDEKKEKVAKCWALVDRLCGKYGLDLMEFSHSESILADTRVEDVTEDEAVENPEFDCIDVSDKVKEVTDKKIVDWDSAKQTFLWTQKKLRSSLEFYKLEDHCSDHVDIIRELSQLYKHLIHFETDADRKSKMFRRRADLLEPLVAELSKEHYLLVIRQIVFELGEIFSDMMDLKMDRLNSEPGNPALKKKVNQLVQQAAQQFQSFLNTMLDKSGKAPDKYNEDTVRPALLAHFHLGRLASKTVVEENSEQHLRNVLTTLASYKQIVDYCNRYPEAKAVMIEEFDACSEMVRLLPVKVEKMRRNMPKSANK